MACLGRQLWIEACRRPDLKDKSIKQLNNMYVCSLHFEEWMYTDSKRFLKKVAFPILNLPPLLPLSTQTEAPRINIIKDLFSRDVQDQIAMAEGVGTINVEFSSAHTSQTIKKITEPRKRKLQKQVLNCAKKLKFNGDRPAHVSRQQFLKGCDKFLSPNLSKIVKAQANLKPHSKSNRYSKEFKLFCLNIYYSNPHAYIFLSKTLCLPSKRSLTSVAIPVGTKVSDYVRVVLSQAIKYLSASERECTFCMDAISLKCSLSYDTRKDKIVGLHEIDDIHSPYAAGYAFTIMLRSIGGNWKQVVGYAFIATSEIDEQLEEWIINTIKQLFALGFNIRAVVSDQGSNFLKFSKSRGISKENPYFEIDGKKVYYIFDVPHLIKSVRNNFMNYNFEFNGKTVSWDDVYNCYQLDKQKDFQRAPKLTNFHMSPNSSQKEKVRLATQVLSNSVKAAMETYTESGDLNPHDGTIEFIDTMDKLFDVLNASNLFSPKPYNKPYRDNEIQRNLLVKTQNLLNNLKVIHKDTGKDVTATKKFINAFLVTINAVIQLYDDLKKESGLNEFYLLTRRLNKESLENFVGVIQQAGGRCRKPTCIQFERAFRKSFLCQIFKLCGESKCADDFDKVLSQYGDFIQNKSIFTLSGVSARPSTQNPSPNFDILDKNSFLYICGYVFRRCLVNHKCLSMINYASSTSGEPTTTLPSFSGLQVLPADFIEYCYELEARFCQKFCPFVGNKILDKLFVMLSGVEFKTRPCPCFPQDFMIKLFIRMRINYVVKFNNRKLKKMKNKVSRKYLAVQHL